MIDLRGSRCQLKILLSIWACLGASLCGMLHATPGSTMTTGAAVVKSSSKSVSGVLVSTAGISGSSSREKDPVLGMIFDRKLQPELCSLVGVQAGVRLNYADDGLGDAARASVDRGVQACANKFRFTAGDVLEVRTSSHARFTRRGWGAELVGEALLIAPGIGVGELEGEIRAALARAAWRELGPERQHTWAVLAGWTRHPAFPFIETRKGFPAAPGEPDTRVEDFCASLLRQQWEGLSDSRKLFLDQAYVGGIKSEKAKDFSDIAIRFAFISELGVWGSSQGHCALQLEKAGEERFAAYLARFDWDRPVHSTLTALFGSARRDLEIVEGKSFVERYREEGREVVTVDLQLDADEKERLLFRLRECLEGEEGRYSFFRQNCAGPLRDLMAYACPERREGLERWHTPKSLYAWASRHGDTPRGG